MTALVLGWIGFDRCMAALGQPGSFLDKLYLSAPALRAPVGAVPPPVPWQLDVARFLAPAMTAYATVSAVVVILDDQVSTIRARMSSNHVVVCGLGRLGALLAKDAVAAPGTTSSPSSRIPGLAPIGECREEGIIVLIGDATDPHAAPDSRG